MSKPMERDPSDDLRRLLDQSNVMGLETLLDGLSVGETARSISRLNHDEQVRLVTLLDPEHVADIVEQIPDSQAVDLIEHLSPQAAAAIVDQLPSDQQADLIGDLRRGNADAIIAAMDPDEARDVRFLGAYSDDVAGGLMVTEYLAYSRNAAVADLVKDLRSHADKYRRYDVQYIYVLGAERRLVGVLRLRDLLLAPANQTISDLMIVNPLSIRDSASLDDLRDFFDRHPFFGAPVVNERNVLLGLVQRSAVEEALAEQSHSNYAKSQGIIGGEELRSMPLLLRARRRLSWLSVNILLNILAASVIAVYQETLAAVIALAVFLPIISDMSGCSGNQAVAVSLRELTLGLIRPAELLRVWIKEISVGAINGVALGILIAIAALLWKGNPYLGVVVGTAMAINTMVAVSIGGIVPLVLRRWKMDPALASGPILTTVTDMCGFFLVLQLATVFLSRL